MIDSLTVIGLLSSQLVLVRKSRTRCEKSYTRTCVWIIDDQRFLKEIKNIKIKTE